jgi:large subunit ribosomal protein L21
MYAIVKIQGQQFKVEKNQKLFVHRINAEEGEKLEIKDVLLVDNKGKVKIGTPTVKGASISAKVLQHVKGDKVLVFKKKRRKGYKKLNGHRQQFTQILIEDIFTTATQAKKVAEKEEKKEVEISKEEKTDEKDA